MIVEVLSVLLFLGFIGSISFAAGFAAGEIHRKLKKHQ